jgi:hypothetical protein
MPWQLDVADVAGELVVDPDTDRPVFAYPIVVVVVPRRAGKTALTLATAAQRASMTRARCWYTAHKREAAATLFRDEWVPLLEPLVDRRLVRIRRSQGSEGFTVTPTGGRVALFPPTANALHAQNCDLAIIDEAWAFDITTGEAIEAGVRPAQLTRPLRQTWIVSAGGTELSTWLDRWMVLGQGGAEGVCYVEWSADPTAPDYDPYDPQVIAAAHPAVGVTISARTILEDARTMDRALHERVHLNVWPRPQGGGGAIDQAAWLGCVAPDIAPVDPVAFGVEVDPDRTWAAIAVAGADGDRLAVELVDVRPGTAWVAERLAELDARWRPTSIQLDPSGPAGALLPDLYAVGLIDPPLHLIDTRGYAQACGYLYDAVTVRRLAHRAQPELDAAVLTAQRRPIAGAWGWHRTTATTPLGAATLAAWGAVTWGGGAASVH